MSREKRLEAIRNVEQVRGTRVVAYITGDRQPNLGTQIAADVFPMFYDLLSRVGATPKLDLFIYSTGGLTMAAWGLVNLLREFCDSLAVLVPFRALSTATLIALGANEIIMTRLGQLSPVDPSVTTPFNPQAPQPPGMPSQALPVSVEDVRGFLELARGEAGLKEESVMADVFSQLASDVRPMALGNVHRAKEQIKMLTEKLLSLRNPRPTSDEIEKIKETLTRNLFSHDYLIGRKEAKAIIGMPVTDAPKDVEDAMMQLFRAYADDLRLNKPYSSESELGTQQRKDVTFDRAYIETTEASFVFRTVRSLNRMQIPQQPAISAIAEMVREEGWITGA